MLGLYHNEGNGLFVDEAPSSTVGRASLLSLTFGVFFFDYDLDGYPDIFAANGHIEDEIGRVQPKVQLQGIRRCCSAIWATAASTTSVRRWAPAFTKAMVARGAAYADFDHDGDLDVLISTNNGPAVSAAQRRRQPQPLAECAAGGDAIESRRHRRGGARGERRRQAVEHGAQRVELLLAKRPGADFRTGRRMPPPQCGSGVAQRGEAAVQNVKANQRVLIDEGRGLSALP